MTCPQCAFPLTPPPRTTSTRQREEGKAIAEVGYLEPRGFWETWLFLWLYFGLVFALMFPGVSTVILGKANLELISFLSIIGLVTGVVTASMLASQMKGIKIAVPIGDKNTFVTKLTVAMGELRFRLKSRQDDYLVFEPPTISLKILPFSPARIFEVIVILDTDSATILGPRTPVNRLQSRLV